MEANTGCQMRYSKDSISNGTFYLHWSDFINASDAPALNANKILCVSDYVDCNMSDDNMRLFFACDKYRTYIDVKYNDPLRINCHTDSSDNNDIYEYVLSDSAKRLIIDKYAPWLGIDSLMIARIQEILSRARSMNINASYMTHYWLEENSIKLAMLSDCGMQILADISKHSEPNFGVLICRINNTAIDVKECSSRAAVNKKIKNIFQKMNRKFPKYVLFFDTMEQWTYKLTSSLPDEKPHKYCSSDSYDTVLCKPATSRYLLKIPSIYYSKNFLNIPFTSEANATGTCRALNNDSRLIINSAYENLGKIHGNPHDIMEDTDIDDTMEAADEPVDAEYYRMTELNRQTISEILIKISTDKRAFLSMFEFFKPDSKDTTEYHIRLGLIHDFNTYLNDALTIIKELDGKIPLCIPSGKTAKTVLKQCSEIHERAMAESALNIIPNDDIMKCPYKMPWYIEHFRIKTTFQMRAYGVKFHHCLGSLINRKSMFFNWKTVCAEVNFDFFTESDKKSPVFQCYDAFDKTTELSKRFEKFLCAAMEHIRKKVAADSQRVMPLTVTEPDNKICNYDDRVGSKSIGDTRADNTGIQKIPNCIILRNFIKP